ncbi:MAG TPA: FxsA family protein [Verrucomicrobiae bacterium]|jgi:UPF0716 protein FxsA|nr:FxsA family protein [Verrucomicrobiae bacterium]
MFGRLLFVFIALPFVEMLVLIKLGEVFGFWSTLAFVLVMGFAGAAAMRIQGMRTLSRIQNELRAGRVPAEEMMDGFLIFLAGILMITPGVISDCIAILIMVPFTRKLFKQWLRRKFDEMLRSDGTSTTYRFFIGGPP